MKQYPKMTIDIRSHTDSRQTHQYNEILSQKRAQSTLEYMVRNGINKERLTIKDMEKPNYSIIVLTV